MQKVLREIMKADAPVQKMKISKREKRTQEFRRNEHKPQDELGTGSDYIMQQLKICKTKQKIIMIPG